MSSLVGYGVSSDSEEEQQVTQSGREDDVQTPGESRTRNFLLESASTSGESSSESGPESQQDDPAPPPAAGPAPPAPSHAPRRLPPPPLGVCGGGVFDNPFRERVEESLSALQRHVPLTLHARPSHIGGRRVCVAYRRDGRCRFGIGCRFAHDSDLQSAAPPPPPGRAHTDGRGAEEEGGGGGGENDRRRKRRVGVTDGLVPPKRALKQYALQRDKVSHM